MISLFRPGSLLETLRLPEGSQRLKHTHRKSPPHTHTSQNQHREVKYWTLFKQNLFFFNFRKCHHPSPGTVSFTEGGQRCFVRVQWERRQRAAGAFITVGIDCGGRGEMQRCYAIHAFMFVMSSSLARRPGRWSPTDPLPTGTVGLRRRQ